VLEKRTIDKTEVVRRPVLGRDFVDGAALRCILLWGTAKIASFRIYIKYSLIASPIGR